MNFKELVRLSFLVIAAIFLTSCSSTDSSQIREITPQEYSVLLNYSRQVISKFPESKITRREKIIIYRTEPKFNVTYISGTTGSYDLSWDVKGKNINYVGEGDLTKPEDSFRKVVIIAVGVTADK